MNTADRQTMRVAFQGEPGAFSEAAAIQLLGGAITVVPRATFDAAFRAIEEAAANYSAYRGMTFAILGFGVLTSCGSWVIGAVP